MRIKDPTVIEITPIDIKQADIVVLRIDLKEVDPKLAMDIYNKLVENLPSDKPVIGLPMSTSLELFTKEQLLKWVDGLKKEIEEL